MRFADALGLRGLHGRDHGDHHAVGSDPTVGLGSLYFLDEVDLLLLETSLPKLRQKPAKLFSSLLASVVETVGAETVGAEVSLELLVGPSVEQTRMRARPPRLRYC